MSRACWKSRNARTASPRKATMPRRGPIGLDHVHRVRAHLRAPRNPACHRRRQGRVLSAGLRCPRPGTPSRSTGAVRDSLRDHLDHAIGQPGLVAGRRPGASSRSTERSTQSGSSGLRPHGADDALRSSSAARCSSTLKQLLVDLLARAGADELDRHVLVGLVAGEADHVAGQVEDPHRLAHLEHEDVARAARRGRPPGSPAARPPGWS